MVENFEEYLNEELVEAENEFNLANNSYLAQDLFIKIETLKEVKRNYEKNKN